MPPSSGRGSRISTAAKFAIAPNGRDRIELRELALNFTVATHLGAAQAGAHPRRASRPSPVVAISPSFKTPDETRSFDAGKRATVSEDPYRWLVAISPTAIGDGSTHS